MSRHFEAGNTLFAEALDFAGRQVRALMERDPDFYPMYTHHGRWRHDLPAWTHWCDGFLPGMMWILYARGRRRVARAGRALFQAPGAAPVRPRRARPGLHLHVHLRPLVRDRGRRRLNAVLIQAGRTMALRFREKGQYLRSFVSEDSLFIDIMMNVGIVFYAARETGDERLFDTAMRHCLTTRRVLVRGDGSTAHEGFFDLETGEFLRQTTHQGFRGDSCWSRGLAWALYGFGTAYGFTRDARFLRTAEACADFYIANPPADGVPPWDFDAPEESRELVDTSAAAIAASGMLQLAGLAADPLKGAFYARDGAPHPRDAVRAVRGGADPEWEGILKGGVYHLHKGLGVDESVMWGEYFFVEALDRALREGRPENPGKPARLTADGEVFDRLIWLSRLRAGHARPLLRGFGRRHCLARLPRRIYLPFSWNSMGATIAT